MRISKWQKQVKSRHDEKIWFLLHELIDLWENTVDENVQKQIEFLPRYSNGFPKIVARLERLRFVIDRLILLNRLCFVINRMPGAPDGGNNFLTQVKLRWCQIVSVNEKRDDTNYYYVKCNVAVMHEKIAKGFKWHQVSHINRMPLSSDHK